MKHKTQIWLRDDQTELVVSSLKIIRTQLHRESRPAFETLEMAAKFTANRIDEILAIIEPKNANPVLPNVRDDFSAAKGKP